MQRTLALTCILKDEIENLPKFCESIAGVFDEYHFTDTGSTDGSIDWLDKNAKSILKCDNVHIHHFKWINDFSAARNHALPFIKSDYWMWMDLDDVLMNQDNVLSFKRSGMDTQDIWYIPYHYAHNDKGECVTQFARERICKTSLPFKFKEFLHEGVDAREVGHPVRGQILASFYVKHERGEKEKKRDEGRNIAILEARKGQLSDRLKWYYGKELADVGRYKEASEILKDAVKLKLEEGDRNLALQYLVNSLMNIEEYVEAIKYGILAIQKEPNRAEFWCLVGECYLKLGLTENAIPFWGGAKSCLNKGAGGLIHEFTTNDAYTLIPRLNLAYCYFMQGWFEQAKQELEPVKDLNNKTKELYGEIIKAIHATTIPADVKQVDDIVISCPNENAYSWDEDKYKTQGLGGSETAAVEMASWLKKLTGRKVKIYQRRIGSWVAPSGVEYVPVHHIHDYMREYKPALHIAWRHPAKFTDAKSVIWSHDLFTPGAETHENYDNLLALSNFHKDMLMGMQGIPKEKILITRNGINPEKFKGIDFTKKQKGKVIWPNSPDRGLEFAIFTMDIVRKTIPDAELYCFYGMENMEKYGLKDKADYLRSLIKDRPWVKYIGNVDQSTLIKEFASSEVWLYTASFIETFCISALEALNTKCWPVVRYFGALQDTMKEANEKKMCDLLDVEMNMETVPLFAEKVIESIQQEKWKSMDFDINKYTWESVAKEWIDMFKL